MARIRTIKPDFWTDETVGGVSIAARFLFIGTWTFADDHGNLERSARQLKAQVLPYDSLDAEPLVQELITAGLLLEYTVDGKKFLHIKGFGKHQHIERRSKPRHPLPAPSPPAPLQLPAPSPNAHRTLSSGLDLEREMEMEVEGTRTPERARACERLAAIAPDPPTSSPGEPPPKPDRWDRWELLEQIRAAYPAGVYAAADWLLAERELAKRLEEGADPAELLAGCERYAAQCVARECGTRYVRSPKDFFSLPAQRWRDPFPLPTGGKPTYAAQMARLRELGAEDGDDLGAPLAVPA